jgi:mRNA interferase MazF
MPVGRLNRKLTIGAEARCRGDVFGWALRKASVTLCPITTFVIDETEDFRIPVEPDDNNGLRQPSFIMSDKLITLPVQRIGPLIGQLDQSSMKRVAVALRFWIDL